MKEAFEKALFLEVASWENSRLKEAALYALEGEAKRIRPLTAFLIANTLSPGFDNYHPLIALELAHTSSLILDDLPMMDDAKQRRGKPALHIRFNQQEALLTAVGLISESFRQLQLAATRMNDSKREKECFHILQNALVTTTEAGGLSGAPLGQWMDLTLSHEIHHPLLTMMQKKNGGVFFFLFHFRMDFWRGRFRKSAASKRSSLCFWHNFSAYG